jgi:cytochrome c553
MTSLKLGVYVLVAYAGATLATGCADKMVPAPGALNGECGSDAPCATAGSAGAAPGPSGTRPVFLATTTASTPPPPISGGTLLVTNDGTTAVMSDPDRDAIYVVDVVGMGLRATIPLKPGDQPGRLVQDGEGRVHVALRGSGALVTIDPGNGAVLARRSVCPAPRGVAWDATSDGLWVACATGELVQLPSMGEATRSIKVARDMRDVLVQNGTLMISTFRSAQLLQVSPVDGKIMGQPHPVGSPAPNFQPHVAWRTVAAPSGRILTIHQAESTDSISTQVPGGYGGGGGPVGFAFGFDDDAGLPPLGAIDDTGDAGVIFVGSGIPLVPVTTPAGSSIVMSALTWSDANGNAMTSRQVSGVLPVDVAVSADGTVAGVTPGNAFTPGLSDFFVIPSEGNGPETDFSLSEDAQPIAVAFDGMGRIVMQSRNPATLWVVPTNGGVVATVRLAVATRDDTGHDVFHTQAGAQIACASCHPEGGDDGHVWILDSEQRRTPSLRGTIVGTAPYHWPGDQPDMPTLVTNVYTTRMAGALLPSDEMGALTGWVESIPAPPAPAWVDKDAAAKGQALFASTGCATCHAGGKLTNNQTVDVGTGGKFQVPPLIGVGWRAPLLHSGCATTIEDRFSSSCSTAAHGDVSKLSATDIANLSAFLETL